MHTRTGAALTGSEKGVRVLLKAGSNPNFSTPSQDIHLFFLFFLFTRISARHPGTSISFQKSSLS